MLIDRLTARFVSTGLVSQNSAGAYRFECTTPETETLCEALAIAADERPIALRDAIISAPNDRLRDLADAFRFGETNKGPKGGRGK